LVLIRVSRRAIPLKMTTGSGHQHWPVFFQRSILMKNSYIC
jgi:hypothetical protein